MRKVALIILSILGGIFLAGNEAKAASRVNLIEKIEADLKRDQAFLPVEREQYLAEFRQQLGAYAFDVLKADNRKGADVVMSLVTEGSFGKVAVKRTVAIAMGAWVAISRGAPADAVEGIAMYGFQKQLDTDKVIALAVGFQDMIRFKVPRSVAQDLIFHTAARNWETQTFNTFKWGLVQAVKKGYDPKDFRRHLLGHFLKGGSGAGAVLAKSMRAFRRERSPKLPAYKSPFTDKKPKPKAAKIKAKIAKPKANKKPAPAKPPSSSLLKPLVAWWNTMKTAIASFIGTPYVWGGTSRRGTDCSGFTQSVFAQVGIALPRNSRQQWKTGHSVGRRQLRDGDLVFFITVGRRISHVGIVVDAAQNSFTHASSSRGVVRSDLNSRYYAKRYAGARRVIQP